MRLLSSCNYETPSLGSVSVALFLRASILGCGPLAALRRHPLVASVATSLDNWRRREAERQLLLASAVDLIVAALRVVIAAFVVSCSREASPW